MGLNKLVILHGLRPLWYLNYLQISAGYGKGSHGIQIANWQNMDIVKAASRVDTGNDPLGMRLLEHFTGNAFNSVVMVGTLHTPTHIHTHNTPTHT